MIAERNATAVTVEAATQALQAAEATLTERKNSFNALHARINFLAEQIAALEFPASRGDAKARAQRQAAQAEELELRGLVSQAEAEVADAERGVEHAKAALTAAHVAVHQRELSRLKLTAFEVKAKAIRAKLDHEANERSYAQLARAIQEKCGTLRSLRVPADHSLPMGMPAESLLAHCENEALQLREALAAE